MYVVVSSSVKCEVQNFLHPGSPEAAAVAVRMMARGRIRERVGVREREHDYFIANETFLLRV
jgi:hypothetical protein